MLPSVFNVKAKMIEKVTIPKKLDDDAAEMMLVGIAFLPISRRDSTVELSELDEDLSFHVQLMATNKLYISIYNKTM